VVLNLVAGFQALGTLMAVGLMMLPAAVAQLWVRSLPALAAIAIGVACFAGYVGLVISFHTSVASGPTIILVAAGCYVFSLLFAPEGAIRRLLPQRHFAKRVTP
jgi:zinc/manganese transport system permease protein